MLAMVDAKKHLKKPKPVRIKKAKAVHVKKPKPVHIKKAKPIKMHKLKVHKIHPIRIGKRHKHHHHNTIVQAYNPHFSPNFTATDSGIVPADPQVDLIVDWLKRIKTVCDVFLSMVDVHPEGSEERRKIIRSLFPPIRVLLEADYAHSINLVNQNDPAKQAALSMASTLSSYQATATAEPF